MLIHSIIIGENINVEEIISEQIYKFVYKADISSSPPFPSIIAALCADARIPAIPHDTLIPQEPPIVAEAMARTRESRAKNPRQTRQATPPQQQPQFQHQQEFPLVSTLTSTPPCPKFIGGLISNKRKIGEALKPSTQGWTKWMIN
ncbi:hypothetical protein PIB30_094894 [Stylosanthes scabra]|uniref:Uncharacterized protein n=1 Tax=Stylosanthes scabra TaxID=79078 RepID=A0ABU6YUU4_9FABA|nr:hypothetical protein [Stylosanthes scabra]